ncbi:peptide ABC transporter substrate-binding protein [Nostoc sp. 3335mG]|nr:peptide ABC transporter substrate-binding protein [Nostoc sp. 3335mG]
MSDTPFMTVRDLVRHFKVANSQDVVHAVDGVSFSIFRNETLAVVGESGSGKTTLGRLLIRLLAPTAGSIELDGSDISALSDAQMKPLRRRIQMIFQDPYSSLDPRMSVEQTLGEALAIHGLGKGNRRERIAELLSLVGLDPSLAKRFPHQFSGGQRQRIGIARALSVEPEMIVGDEPVSALDVSVRAQVLNLLSDIRSRLGLTFVMITHDLGVVRHSADRILVLYLGKVVEIGAAEEIFARPGHPYTRALINATPDPFRPRKAAAEILLGEVPSPINPPSGCRFHTRCPMARPICSAEEPLLQERQPGHLSACHFAHEVEPPASEDAPPPRAYQQRLDIIRTAYAGREK